MVYIICDCILVIVDDVLQALEALVLNAHRQQQVDGTLVATTPSLPLSAAAAGKNEIFVGGAWGAGGWLMYRRAPSWFGSGGAVLAVCGGDEQYRRHM